MATDRRTWTEFPPEFHEHIFFTLRSNSQCAIPTKGTMFPQTSLNEEQKLALWNSAFEMMEEEWYDLVVKEKRAFAFDTTHSFDMKMEYVTSDPQDSKTKLYCFSFNVCPLLKPACRGITVV